ncbi:MAG: S-layer homology domain-containing protein, partial [Eubacteriales bacterium]
NTVTFETDSFSNYTLMAKIAAFADILSHWARNDIQLMFDKGIVKGMTANSFAPDANITRAQFATLLVKALGLAESQTVSGVFKDVKSNAWYRGTVEAAAAHGLVVGYANGTFGPDGKITRQEMAAMVAKALKVGGKTVTLSSGEAAQLVSKFSDKQQIGSWAQDSVAIAVKEGIITGRTATTFVAKANATRAEGTVMIKKVLESLGKI